MRRFVFVEGTQAGRTLYYRYNVDRDDGDIRIMGCDIMFDGCMTLAEVDDADYLWDHIPADEQDRLIEEAFREDDPLDRDVPYRNEKARFIANHRRGLN